MNLAILHLCDSLFPIGAFAYSDGLESAASDGRIATAGDLRVWIDVSLDETIGRLEGPAVWLAWRAIVDGDRHTLESLDEELHALRPSSAARRSSRAMGMRLLTAWSALHPADSSTRDGTSARSSQAPSRSGAASTGAQSRPEPALERWRVEGLPLAFAAVCADAGVERRDAVESFAYTRLAATVSAAMRLMPIGQTDAHAVLARALDRVPAVVDAIVARDGRLESFAPALDIETMRQQYLHSRLFRS